MKFAIFLAVFLIAELAFAADSDVLQLGDSDFDTVLKDTPVAVVAFTATWCGHCKKLKPEFSKAAELMRTDDVPVAFVNVDCPEAGKDTCSKFGVTGYPTIKIFKNGEKSADYNGPREAFGMVKYMRAQVGPASKDILTVDAFEAFLKVQEAAIVGFFEKESDLKAVFLKYADKQREKYRFAHTSDPAVLSKVGETDSIYLYRAPQLANKFEESSVEFSGKTVEELSAFIKENFHGLVGHRTRDTMVDFESPAVFAYYAVDYVKNPKGTNYWRNRILKVAKEAASKYPFKFSISSKDDFQHELNEYGFDYTGDKPVVVARDATNQKFVMKDEFSIENLQQFIQDLDEGSLEAYVKSEPIPENNDAGTKIAVTRNFDELVTKYDGDVLVEFYAEWCGHCKKLAPIWDELGEKMKDENVQIVKMEATKNDVPPLFSVRGFPTLYWVPKNSKSKPEKYEGGRELEDFIKYISKHATNELKGYDRSGKPKKTEL